LLLLCERKGFEVLNRLIFDYLPLYSKFRAPSSITSVTTILIPILGILGLSRLLDGSIEKEAALKKLYIATGIGVGIPLLFALVGPGMFDFSNSGDARYAQSGYDVNALIADRKSLMRTDSFRTAGLILLTAGLIWAYLKDKINQLILFAGLGAFVLFDMWSVGKRYLGVDKFSNRSITSQYQVRPVDQQIFALENINPENPTINPIGRGGYRVVDMSINTFRNQGVLDMLNAKYFISKQGKVQQNPNALGTAWFVNTIKKVNSPNEEMEGLNQLKPATEAIVLEIVNNSQFFLRYGMDPTKGGKLT